MKTLKQIGEFLADDLRDWILTPLVGGSVVALGMALLWVLTR